jgi:hypothetical protein
MYPETAPPKTAQEIILPKQSDVKAHNLSTRRLQDTASPFQVYQCSLVLTEQNEMVGKQLKEEAKPSRAQWKEDTRITNQRKSKGNPETENGGNLRELQVGS